MVKSQIQNRDLYFVKSTRHQQFISDDASYIRDNPTIAENFHSDG